ncbi:hypothetical protein ABT340_30485, partial [Streptosporangium sp. NPDC000239]|uniref:hypothetical protein n=1 Tax=Streptosporangium sp. NPDC000239 TaxID=3154248 RepID=UPI00331F2E74
MQKPYQMTDEPATGGLKSPPPLPWASKAPEQKSRKTEGKKRSETHAQSAGFKKQAPSKGHAPAAGSPVRALTAGARKTRIPTTSATASVPTVSALRAGPGTQSSGVWILSSPTPWFEAKVTDPDGRKVGLDVQVEHDPSVPAQGTGYIWSYGTGWTGTSGTTVQTAQSDPLTDGWLIRWRVRGTTYTGSATTVNGPWSEWQTAKVDVSKPSVSSLDAGPGTEGDGLWTLSSLEPWFEAKVTDPDGRNVGLSVEVEHDPSAAGQGTGRIWSYGTGVSDPSGSYVWAEMPSDELKDGWLIRWRVRGSVMTADHGSLYGAWSLWQTAKVDISKPTVTFPNAGPGTNQGAGLWTLSSPRPWFEAKVTDPEGRNVGLDVQVEHDPSVPAQGTGRIWSYGTGWTGTSGTTVQTAQSDPLTDGWLIRWRVRGTTYTTGSATVNGPWSGWQTARVDISKPSVTSLRATPGTYQGGGLTVISSPTPAFEAKVTDPEGRKVGLSVEVEHDPSVPAQGTGRIWSYGTGWTGTSGTTVQTAQSDPLTDGWLIRWRVRGTTYTGSSTAVNGPWSEWQTARIEVSRPAVTSLRATPGTYQGGGLTVISSPTPAFEAKVTDPDGRKVGLSVQVEHDPSVPAQGTGYIWSYGTGWTGTSGTTVQTAQSDPL